MVETRGHRRASVIGALRQRNFALLWSGQTTSLAGNGIFAVALPLVVLRLTNSPLDLGIVAAARTIPALALLLFGGALADRVSPRLVMFASDGVCGVCAGAVAVLIAVGRSTVWQLAVLSAIFGVASAFFKPAATVITTEILPADLLVSASSLNSMSQSLAQYLLGPLAGGVVVVAIGPAWALGIDAGSFVVSAACLALLRVTARPRATSSRLSRGIRQGLSYCRSQPWLWWSMIAVGFANLISYVPLTVLVPVLVRGVFGAGPVALGIVLASSGAGGMVAALVAARWKVGRRQVRAIWTAWSGAGVAAAALGASPRLWMAAVFAGVAWFGVTYGNILWFPLMQREIPRPLLGRASSVDWLLSMSLTPLGALAGGALAGVVGVRLTLIGGGLLAAATALVLLVPGVTAPDHPSGRPVQP